MPYPATRCTWSTWDCVCKDGYKRNWADGSRQDELEEPRCYSSFTCDPESSHPRKDCPWSPWDCDCKDGYRRDYRNGGICKPEGCPHPLVPDRDGNCVCPHPFVPDGMGGCECPHPLVPDRDDGCKCPPPLVPDGMGGCEHAICPDTPLDLSPVFGSFGGCAAVLLNEGTELTMSHGDPTGVHGNLCAAGNNKISASGKQRVTGDVLVAGSGLSFENDRVEGEVVFGSSGAAAAIDAIRNLVDDYASQCDGESKSKIKIDSPTTTDYCGDSTGTVFVCVDDLEFKDMWTLEGSCTVVLNVFGKFKMDGSNNQGANLIINSLSTEDVASSGGGGGCGCCKSKVNGAVFAKGDIRLSPGFITFAAAEGDITMASGSEINCPPPGEPEDVCLA